MYVFNDDKINYLYVLNVKNKPATLALYYLR